jgi:ATP-binding cassette subfamily B protein
VDLLVPAGSSLALVGGSGCGKSTLSSLVPRLRDPSQGRVLVDGVDLRDVSFDDLSRIVGVVSQDPYMLHASIRDNLLYAKPDATEAELWRALHTAQVGDLVAALPKGLDTVVGARGLRFSGGEKQRLAIARTLLRDPKVLVLDEATSALDTTTERELQAALDELARGRTTITVAHRMATVRNADQIAVLSDGRVVEHGTHAHLLAQGGRYAALAGAGTPTPEFAAA